MTTTAYYRTLAQDYEARCEWGRAADAWQMAIDLYPQHSKLGKADIEKMEQRKEDCLRAYFPS